MAVGFQQGHIDGIPRAHADEGVGAVEGVDQPHAGPLPALCVRSSAAFFADHRDTQMGEACTDDFVAGMVGIGHR